MKKVSYFGKRGQSLVEILIGLALIAVGIGFAVILVFGGQKVLIDRGNAVEARILALEGLEAVRSIRERSWEELTDGEHGFVFQNGEWQLTSSSTKEGIFTKKIIITTESENVKKIESEVGWETEPLRKEKVEFVTLLTNWRHPIPPPDPGDPGGGGTSGDWKNPRTLGSVDLGPGNSATDLDVINKIIYLSAEASAPAKPDFFIVDATNGESPFIVSSLDTGLSLNAVDASGNYAYLANRSTTAQLQIIDISNINAPVLLTSFQLPDVSGSGAVGQSIFYAESKVYLGTKKAQGPEFHVIDVSNPSSPIHLGSFELNDDINDIHVSGPRAYLATDLDNAGLTVVDISNPSAITLLGQTFSSDTESVFNVQKSLTLIGAAQEFYLINTTDPATMVNLGSISAGNVINDIVARDTLAFLATSNSNREFQVIDITNTSNPELWSFFNFPQVATGIDYEDNLVYVAVRSNDALRIITSSP